MINASPQAAPEEASMLKSLFVLGVPVTPFDSYAQAIRHVTQGVNSGRQAFWAAINPQKIYLATHDEKLRQILCDADVGICDGIGVSIATKMLHGQFLARCTGCDMFFRLLPVAAKKGWRVFLLGASEDSNRIAGKRLREKYPGLQIVGRRNGYFTDSGPVVEQINRSGADLLFVAMGSPAQEYWIAEHRHSLRAAFCMGVGGTLNVASGMVRRAPTIFRKTGTEFVYQLLAQPKRWKRQIVYWPYMAKVLRAKITGPSQAGRA